MANEDQVAILRQGAGKWNQWVNDHYGARIDLRNADLRNLDLIGARLFDANLRGADLRGAVLMDARLRGATLREATLDGVILSNADLTTATLNGLDLRFVNLSSADLSLANIRKANLAGTRLYGANLRWADLRGSDLTGANLEGAVLIETRVDRAILTGARVYGSAVWNLTGIPASQNDLIITPEGDTEVTVDNLKVAQFLYLLLRNSEIRDVIDTITSKAVLILGRFTPDRKAVLNALREALRARNYLPVLFDFAKPAGRDLTETVSTLAHLARFVVADITDAKSIPQELQRIVPNLPSVPVQPLILASQYEYGMFKDFGGYLSVLPPHRYENIDKLIASLDDKVIAPVIERAVEIAERRLMYEQSLLGPPKSLADTVLRPTRRGRRKGKGKENTPMTRG